MTTGRVATVVAEGFSLLESPRWVDESLYVSDFFTHRILRFPSPVSLRYAVVCEVPGQPSGLGLCPDGSILAASMLGMALMKWDSGSVAVFADLSSLVTGPLNDMAMDSKGRCYVGNFGLRDGRGTALEPTAIIRVDPDASVCIVADDVVFPNGMVLSADEQTLYVAETYRGRITAFAVRSDGTLGERRTWADFGPPGAPLDIPAATKHLSVLPDGLTLDCGGALWVADAKGHGIARVVEGGQQTDFVDTGSLSVYAAALGGPDLTTLFLCCAPPVESFDPSRNRRSVLLSCAVEVPGVPRR